MQENDRVRLLHMLEAAREALSFASGKTRKDLDENRQLVLAVVRDIEIIGEAADLPDLIEALEKIVEGPK